MALAMRNHTFQFYDRLTDSGMTDSQARTIIEAISDLSDMNLKELATKADLKGLATNEQLVAGDKQLDNKIDVLREKLEQKINALHVTMEENSGKLQTAIAKANTSNMRMMLVGIWIPIAVALIVFCISGTFKHLGL